VQPIVPICLEDEFLISIPLFTHAGDFYDYQINEYSKRSHIDFMPYKFKEIPAKFKDIRSKNAYKMPTKIDALMRDIQRKLVNTNQDYYSADLNRVCEAEELVTEWFPVDLKNAQRRQNTL